MANDPYGLLRVIAPQGTLPQRAEVLDPSLPIRDDELLIDAEHVNVDAASFRQIATAEEGDPERIKAHILDLVRRRGKLHNPVTGSGGMLVGRVREVGPNHPARATLSPGDRVATLVSLSLTPLAISEIRAVHPEVERLDVRAHAILFATGLFAKLPEDMPDTLSLAALDVCGAPALTGRLAEPGMRVLVIGAGKSGALCCAQARRSGARQVIALDVSRAALDRFRAGGLATDAVVVDATRPVEVLRRVEELTGGALCDLVINCASVPETEVSAGRCSSSAWRRAFRRWRSAPRGWGRTSPSTSETDMPRGTRSSRSTSSAPSPSFARCSRSDMAPRPSPLEAPSPL
jgi:L-erythro-3,5-diaminohexanoate dehydrogenase